jgi:hypothetical protein
LNEDEDEDEVIEKELEERYKEEISHRKANHNLILMYNCLIG